MTGHIGTETRQVTVSYGKLIKNSELGLNGDDVLPSEIKEAEIGRAHV